MSSRDESDAESMYMDMLEDICDGIQYHLSINSRESRYTIIDRIKQSQEEWKGALLSTRNMGKVLYQLFKAAVNEISQRFTNFW